MILLNVFENICIFFPLDYLCHKLPKTVTLPANVEYIDISEELEPVLLEFNYDLKENVACTEVHSRNNKHRNIRA